MALRCARCHGLFVPGDLHGGFCGPCGARQRTCAYCRQPLDEALMYHIPRIPAAPGWRGAPARWICAKCWASPERGTEELVE